MSRSTRWCARSSPAWARPGKTRRRAFTGPTATRRPPPRASARSSSGIRLQCARCHNHPFDAWTQDDYYGLAAFFANIARKQPSEARKDRLDLHEINGDEFIYLSGRPEMVQPRTGSVLQPKCLNGPAVDRPGGDNENALDKLADWLTRNNPQFSRNLANRVWFHLFGRGIVDPVDDFRESNPPSNPALLAAVTAQFEADGMRLKPLVGWIMKSRTYQLSATPDATNADDEANFSHAVVRLLPAEVLARRDQPGRRGARTIPARSESHSGGPASRAHRAASRF